MTHGKLIARNNLKFSCNKTPSSPQLNFPSHCHINVDPNLRFSTNRCICLEDRTPDQPLAATETEAAPVLRTQPPASLPEKAVSLAEERRSWPPRTRQHQQHPALSSSVHPLIFSWPSIDTIAAAVKICTTVQPTNRAGLS